MERTKPLMASILLDGCTFGRRLKHRCTHTHIQTSHHITAKHSPVQPHTPTHGDGGPFKMVMLHSIYKSNFLLALRIMGQTENPKRCHCAFALITADNDNNYAFVGQMRSEVMSKVCDVTDGQIYLFIESCLVNCCLFCATRHPVSNTKILYDRTRASTASASW